MKQEQSHSRATAEQQQSKQLLRVPAAVRPSRRASIPKDCGHRLHLHCCIVEFQLQQHLPEQLHPEEKALPSDKLPIFMPISRDRKGVALSCRGGPLQKQAASCPKNGKKSSEFRVFFRTLRSCVGSAGCRGCAPRQVEKYSSRKLQLKAFGAAISGCYQGYQCSWEQRRRGAEGQEDLRFGAQV